jgi:DNA-binding CsgD family transcriptional regulator
MAPLSQSDCRAILSAIEIIYEPTSLELFPAAALSAVSKVLACNTICYNEVTFPQSRMSWITEPANALPGPILRERFNRNLPEHPLIAHSGSKNTSGSLRISDFLTQTQFHRLALYNEYYRPLNVEYQLGTTISVNPQKIVAVGLDRDCPDFSEDERLCLDLLRPHLIQAYRNLQTLSLMQRTIEDSGRHYIIVNRSNQVQMAADNVWQILAQFFDISRSPDQIPEMLKNWLIHERSRFYEDSSNLAPSIPLTVNQGIRKLIINLIWGGKTGDRDLILIEEQVTNLVARPGSNLTIRETEILAWLSQGKTNAEIGQILSLSPRTVKKHLEHIYSKLHVHRRSAAVARFL